MDLGIVLIMYIISAIFRAIIFKRYDIRPVKSFIPGVNKYELGMITNSKKLALANGIGHVLFWLYFIFCFGYEIWIMQNYTASVDMSSSIQSIVEVTVPNNVANIAVYTKYGLIAFALIMMILWCMMMWKFTMHNNKSPWWILFWAFLPVVPYVYFAFVPDYVSKDGKRYTMKKVEINE